MPEKIRELPPEEAALLRSLRGKRDRARYRALMVELSDAGYSLAAIAEVAKVSRQRIHQILLEERSGEPRLPTPRARPTLAPETVELLQWAWTESSVRRGSTTEESVPSAAHRVLVDTVVALLRKGKTFAQIADAIGVEEGTVRGRMLRAGVTRKGARLEPVVPEDDVA